MKPKASGFTLIELMVTVAVLAILVTIALPSFRAVIIDSRMAGQSNEFLAALTFARSEAIKRNANVTLSAKSGSWANGWVVTDANGTTLRDHAALEASSTLSGGGATTLTFGSNGQAGAAVTFNLCNPDPSVAPGRNIIVGVSGRASIVKPGTCS